MAAHDRDLVPRHRHDCHLLVGSGYEPAPASLSDFTKVGLERTNSSPTRRYAPGDEGTAEAAATHSTVEELLMSAAREVPFAMRSTTCGHTPVFKKATASFPAQKRARPEKNRFMAYNLRFRVSGETWPDSWAQLAVRPNISTAPPPPESTIGSTTFIKRG